MTIKDKKVTYHLSSLWGGLLLVSVLMCAGLGYYYYATSTDNQAAKSTLEGENRVLQTGISSMQSNYSDQKAVQSREAAAKIKEAMQSGDETDRLLASLRPSWSVVSRSDEPNDEYIHRKYQIARGTVPVSAWPEIAALVERLKNIESLAINAIDIQTIGDNNRRDFSRVSLSFSIYVRK